MDLSMGMQVQYTAYTSFTLATWKTFWEFDILTDCRLADQPLGSGTGVNIARLLGC